MNSNQLFQYKGSGLDWVYLLNGYDLVETPYGTGYAIHNAGGLHEAIAREIVTRPAPIRGQELRFLRSVLDLSQAGMGKIVGLSRVQIARLEGKRQTRITPSADRALRLFFGLRDQKRESAERIIEVLSEIDSSESEAASFRESEQMWFKAVA
jgi:transcriptional regulator with XRE-family HTH domain